MGKFSHLFENALFHSTDKVFAALKLLVELILWLYGYIKVNIIHLWLAFTWKIILFLNERKTLAQFHFNLLFIVHEVQVTFFFFKTRNDKTE